MSKYNEHERYLKKIKLEKSIVVGFRILIFITFLGIWEILARNGIINTFTFSSPSLIIKTIGKLFADGELIRHIGITMYEVIISFIVSSVISIIVSTLFWRFRMVSKILDIYITVLNSLPKVALGPLIIIWVGASINSIIFMSLLISTFITIINIYNGFISTPDKYITLMKSFGASKKDIFLKVVLPCNISSIINAFRINISMNLIGVIMGELLVSKRGIGYLIMYGSQVFNINLVISGVFILGVISYILDYSLERISSLYKKRSH